MIGIDYLNCLIKAFYLEIQKEFQLMFDNINFIIFIHMSHGTKYIIYIRKHI